MKTRQWETNRPEGDSFDPGGPDWDRNPKRFGPYWEAFTRQHWDALVFQPYRSHMKDDLPALRNFLALALEHSSADAFYLYQTWPNRPQSNPGEKDRAKRLYADIDYQALWERPYPYDETTVEPQGDEFQSRAYFDALVVHLNRGFADRLLQPVRMLPVGEVWYACDRAIRAGQIPGLAALHARDPQRVPGWNPETGLSAGVNLFYADGIHPNPIPHLDGNVANFVNGMTICAVLGRTSPVGLPGAVYGLDADRDAALIRALQELVWDVVSTHPHTGLQPQ